MLDLPLPRHISTLPKSAIRRSSANDLSCCIASLRCNTSAVIEGIADLAAHPTACLGMEAETSIKELSERNLHKAFPAYARFTIPCFILALTTSPRERLSHPC